MEASSAGKSGYGGQRKMSEVLGAFGLLDFTISLGGRFEIYGPFISLIFQFFFGPR
jgi:hypothetical protein